MIQGSILHFHFSLLSVVYTLTKLLPGFEAGGPNTPSNIDPWFIIGNESSIIVGTDRTSCFERNPVALRFVVLCGSKVTNVCPSGGVGVYNPGYWGMVWYFFCSYVCIYDMLTCFQKKYNNVQHYSNLEKYVESDYDIILHIKNKKKTI